MSEHEATASVVLKDLVDLIERELARTDDDPARRAWLERQRRRFIEAPASTQIYSNPASVTRLVAEAHYVRATILEGG